MMIDCNKIMRELLVRTTKSLYTLVGTRVYFAAAPANASLTQPWLVYECRYTPNETGPVVSGVANILIGIPGNAASTSPYEQANAAWKVLVESIHGNTNVRLTSGVVLDIYQSTDLDTIDDRELNAVFASGSFDFEMRPNN